MPKQLTEDHHAISHSTIKENITVKTNCWEFKNCGREAGGKNAIGMGVCPAAIDGRLHGVHGGKNGGRTCWMIAGTLCEGAVQGTFGTKYRNCEQCDFYRTTRKEEGANFQLSVFLLNKLKVGLRTTAS
jgi:hypothetical protein